MTRRALCKTHPPYVVLYAPAIGILLWSFSVTTVGHSFTMLNQKLDLNYQNQVILERARANDRRRVVALVLASTATPAGTEAASEAIRALDGLFC
jgi:ABC-type spermidine/putrescine transport system permease subunit II